MRGNPEHRYDQARALFGKGRHARGRWHLLCRQRAFDAMRPEDRLGYHRPGSVKK